MTSEVLRTAYSQFARWKKEAEGTTAYQNMKAWERVILSEGGTVSDSTSEKQAVATITGNKTFKPDTKKAKVKEFSADYLRKKASHYAPREELKAHLLTKGVTITVKRLSATLSEAPEFTPDKQKGWTLKEFAAA